MSKTAKINKIASTTQVITRKEIARRLGLARPDLAIRYVRAAVRNGAEAFYLDQERVYFVATI